MLLFLLIFIFFFICRSILEIHPSEKKKTLAFYRKQVHTILWLSTNENLMFEPKMPGKHTVSLFLTLSFYLCISLPLRFLSVVVRVSNLLSLSPNNTQDNANPKKHTDTHIQKPVMKQPYYCRENTHAIEMKRWMSECAREFNRMFKRGSLFEVVFIM